MIHFCLIFNNHSRQTPPALSHPLSPPPASRSTRSSRLARAARTRSASTVYVQQRPIAAPIAATSGQITKGTTKNQPHANRTGYTTPLSGRAIGEAYYYWSACMFMQHRGCSFHKMNNSIYARDQTKYLFFRSVKSQYGLSAV